MKQNISREEWSRLTGQLLDDPQLQAAFSPAQQTEIRRFINVAGQRLPAVPNNWGSRTGQVVVWVVGLFSIFAALCSVLVSLTNESWYPVLYGLWLILPPIWFFFEYHFVFDRKHDDNTLEQLQVGQDVAQRFWAALLVLLAGIGYFRWHYTLH